MKQKKLFNVAIEDGDFETIAYFERIEGIENAVRIGKENLRRFNGEEFNVYSLDKNGDVLELVYNSATGYNN